MLSSADLNLQAARCRQLGISSYLVKPVSKAELQRALTTALAKKGFVASSPTREKPYLRPAAHMRRILLVEDNLINQKLALGLLAKQGHSVKLACNGVEAVEFTGAENFDVVLMDVQMPEMDGMRATALIREREEITCKHVFIIAMTAHAMAEIVNGVSSPAWMAIRRNLSHPRACRRAGSA